MSSTPSQPEAGPARVRERLLALGERVRRARRQRRWSRRVLAERAGLSERFLAEVEKGAANPSLMRLCELAEALGESPEALIALGPEAAFAVREAQGRDRFLVLLGLRGAGKSSLGPMLATRLGRDFLELDEEIERQVGLEIGEVFELHGEDWYRRREREVLLRLLEEGRPLVLATGGGLVTDPESFALVRARARTLWLKARPEDHWNRVVAQGDTRPMRDDPRAFDHLCAILAERERFYRQAEVVVDTSGRSVSEVFGAVLAALG
ncbi:MAG: shikimate kinase [Planctomycetota bacterium]